MQRLVHLVVGGRLLHCEFGQCRHLAQGYGERYVRPGHRHQRRFRLGRRGPRRNGLQLLDLLSRPQPDRDNRTESGTSSPIFTFPLAEGHLRHTSETSFRMVRTEVSCAGMASTMAMFLGRAAADRQAVLHQFGLTRVYTRGRGPPRQAGPRPARGPAASGLLAPFLGDRTRLWLSAVPLGWRTLRQIALRRGFAGTAVERAWQPLPQRTGSFSRDRELRTLRMGRAPCSNQRVLGSSPSASTIVSRA